MKTLFSIGMRETTSDLLLIELGPDYCCLATINRPNKSFGFIEFISFEEFELEEKLGDIINQLPSVDRTIVCSAFSQALLSPDKYADSGHSMLEIIYDTPAQKYFSDPIAEWQMTTVYSIPQTISAKLLAKFPGADFYHAYTPAIRIYNGFVASDQVDIHFTTQYFRVLVKKQGKVQLAQTYSYKTPLDVVYYLLKICYEFKLDQSEVFLIVSGLVEQDSALYAELHNYFSNLHFAQAPAYTIPDHNHPHYYFTSLYNLAACVS